MPVLMTMRIQGEAKKLEEYAAKDPTGFRSIADSAKSHGLIAHRFYGNGEGQIMVVDLWPDEQSFQKFFDENSSRIQPMMEAAGATSAPEVTFWREMDMPDKVGWEDSESG